MRIVCPSCTTAYDVPDNRLVPGRSVKCAKCGTGWAPVPMAMPVPMPMPEPAPVSAVEPEPEPVIEPAPAEPIVAPEPAPVMAETRPAVSTFQPPRTAAIGWLLSLVVLIGLGVAAYHWRADIVRVWPPSERAYEAFGLKA